MLRQSQIVLPTPGPLSLQVFDNHIKAPRVDFGEKATAQALPRIACAQRVVLMVFRKPGPNLLTDQVQSLLAYIITVFKVFNLAIILQLL